MNKLVKGSIAGGLGVVLLLGGAGTLALWNQTAVVSGGNVTAGVLTIAADATASTWTDISSDVVSVAGQSNGVAIANIANFKIVPGDKIKFTKTVTINATGNNLKGKLTFDPATIVAGSGAASTALKSKLITTLTASGTGVAATATPSEYTVATNTTNSTVTLVLTIELPSTVGDTAGEGTIAQTGTVDLTNVAFKLNQVRP